MRRDRTLKVVLVVVGLLFTAGSVNLIWSLLIFSFGSTPPGESTPAPRRSEALRRP